MTATNLAHASNGVRLVHRASTGPLALCRSGESFSLRSASLNPRSTSCDSVDEGPYMVDVSVVVDQDPYPGFTAGQGNQMIWLKNYGENKDLLSELEQAGFVQSVGRTIKQGFVSLPLCVVLLDEREILQTCASCRRVESIETVERFKRCAKCKRRYYCSSEHQLADWPNHKHDCKDLVRLDFVSVENRRRRHETEMLNGGRLQEV
ncbi:hypothetical protein JCM10212_004181 [Sporobolomyces blumeae]